MPDLFIVMTRCSGSEILTSMAEELGLSTEVIVGQRDPNIDGARVIKISGKPETLAIVAGCSEGYIQAVLHARSHEVERLNRAWRLPNPPGPGPRMPFGS